MIRIVYQFLRLSWYVVVRWGWGWGWVVAVARMVPRVIGVRIGTSDRRML